MASIYMRIDGYSPKGAATVEDIGGKKDFFAIESVSWSAVRGVGIDVRAGAYFAFFLSNTYPI